MKARLPIPKDMRERVYQFAKEEIERQQIGATRRFLKLAILTARKVFGYGFKKLLEYAREFNNMLEESKKDEIFWYHNDKALDQLGFEFEHEDYEVWDK